MNRQVTMRIEMGRARLSVDELTGLEPGTILELDAGCDDDVEVYLNGRLAASGEPVVMEDELCVRVRHLPSGTDGE